VVLFDEVQGLWPLKAKLLPLFLISWIFPPRFFFWL
jgi:hypothetical protein